MAEDYRVKLEIYDGPLDLLLYLTRREEIDIHDIPIARITEQYLAHLAVLRQIDPDLAGEFLVMAATLMEIKTRMLLPAPQVEGEEGEAAFDPRAALVRQLLEYKAFKDAAGDLREAGQQQALRFGRPRGEAAAGEKDIEDLQLWDLVEAFNAVMASIGRTITHHEIILDDTPVELHVEDILDRLRRDGDMRFRDIFAGRTQKTELIGLFLALLELTRRRAVFIEQEGPFGEIYVYLNPDPPPFEQAPPPVEGEGSEAPAGPGEPAPPATVDSAGVPPAQPSEHTPPQNPPPSTGGGKGEGDDGAEAHPDNSNTRSQTHPHPPWGPRAACPSPVKGEGSEARPVPGKPVPPRPPAGQYVSDHPPDEDAHDRGTETQGTGD